MDRRVKNSFDCVNRISNDNDLENIINACSLIDTTSNGELFHFCAGKYDHDVTLTLTLSLEKKNKSKKIKNKY